MHRTDLHFAPFVNIVVAASNAYGFVGLMLFHRQIGHWDFYLILCSAIASTLMHLSETKHGLPGIPPFRTYSNSLLWMDRLTALVAAVRVAAWWWCNPSLDVFAWASAGLSLLYLSENVRINDHLWFSVTHSAWHCIAFHLLLRCARTK